VFLYVCCFPLWIIKLFWVVVWFYFFFCFWISQKLMNFKRCFGSFEFHMSFVCFTVGFNKNNQRERRRRRRKTLSILKNYLIWTLHQKIAERERERGIKLVLEISKVVWSGLIFSYEFVNSKKAGMKILVF